MKLSDLKTGMWVETRNNNMYLVLKDYDSCRYGKGVLVHTINGFLSFCEYNDDMKHISYEYFDIVQVFRPSGDAFVLNINRQISIWARKEKPELHPNVKTLFEMLSPEYKKGWIAKDKGGRVYLYKSKPIKSDKNKIWKDKETGYYNNIDRFIDKSLLEWLSWEDEEPWYIPDLMAEE